MILNKETNKHCTTLVASQLQWSMKAIHIYLKFFNSAIHLVFSYLSSKIFVWLGLEISSVALQHIAKIIVSMVQKLI